MPKTASVYIKGPELDTLIDNQGLNALWEQSMMCDCIDPITKQPDYNCPYCKGTGIVYLPAKTIKALVYSQQGKIDLSKEIGLIHPATCYVTTKSTDVLGWKDKLSFTEIRCKYSETLKIANNKSTRSYKPITEILAIVIAGKYYLAKDFEIEEDRYITPKNITIPDNTTIGILYYTYPTYSVSSMIKEMRASRGNPRNSSEYTQELPKQALCDRIDFEYNLKPLTRETELDPCTDNTCAIPDNILGE